MFMVPWPFKRAPCFHWRGDVRAAKDFSLSPANGEGYGPGTAAFSFSRGSFTQLKRLQSLPHRSQPGAHRGLKRETFHDGSERGKVAQQPQRTEPLFTAKQQLLFRCAITAEKDGEKKNAPAEPPQQHLQQQQKTRFQSQNPRVLITFLKAALGSSPASFPAPLRAFKFRRLSQRPSSTRRTMAKTAELGAKMLLVTANVGSLFEDVSLSVYKHTRWWFLFPTQSMVCLNNA